MKEYYITGLPPIINIDDGESEEVTKNTIMEILEDAGYEFLKGEELNKLDKAKQIIEKYYEDAQCGIFDSRNILGDPMETIYCDNELQIDICRNYEYFEVFGLEKKEFKELAKYYYSLGNWKVEE